jgi:protein subunit release factor A
VETSQEKPNFIQRNKQVQSSKRLSEKNTNQPTLPKIPSKNGNRTIPQKVEQLEKAVDRLSKGTNQPELQRMLLQEIQGIKSELKEIKQQIGLSPQQPKSKYQR